MHITIAGTPFFTFKLTARQLDILTRYAEGHYDRTCQALADGDGILARWGRRHRDCGLDYEFRAVFSDLDLLTKVLESLQYERNPTTHAIAVAMRRNFSHALEAANSAVPCWRFTLDIGPEAG